ncbi:SRPBCC domain-containing protein [Leifsonia sp. NPDC058230]|uniref:SRPBCC family protein n=1 Tax=Leifsonia sp. NPDC058230 TaxID=3346391 RepID=UPI0036DB6872
MNSPTAVVRKPGLLTFTRTFSAERELVFLALSDAEHLRRWWGPPNFPVVECSIDFRPGGVWHYCLRGRDGTEIWARSVYREIVPPERVSYFERPSDAQGNITNVRPGSFVTITLESRATGTELTAVMRYQSPLDGARAVGYGVEHGFSAALDLLDTLLNELDDARRGAAQVNR